MRIGITRGLICDRRHLVSLFDSPRKHSPCPTSEQSRQITYMHLITTHTNILASYLCDWNKQNGVNIKTYIIYIWIIYPLLQTGENGANDTNIFQLIILFALTLNDIHVYLIHMKQIYHSKQCINSQVIFQIYINLFEISTCQVNNNYLGCKIHVIYTTYSSTHIQPYETWYPYNDTLKSDIVHNNWYHVI
jgi:hypothetical protein